MISKSDIKYLRSLHQKKYRDAHRLFTVEGEKMVDEAINCKADISTIYATPLWISRNKATESTQTVVEVDERSLAQICQLKTPNQVMAVVKKEDSELELTSLNGKISLALESIRDPGNMGTLIRIADWFGIDTILVSPDSVEIYNHKVVQSSMGGIFRVNIHEVGLPLVLGALAADEMNIMSAVMNGTALQESERPKEGIIILGNESTGVSKELQQLSTSLIKINGAGGAESLNVAVAGGILAYWAVG